MFSPKLSTVVVALLVSLLVTACGGGDSSNTPTAPAPSVPTSITITGTTTPLQSIGATTQLTATVRDQRGDVMTGVSISWTSSAAEVATASATGLVTAVANGSATITATTASINAAVTIEVEVLVALTVAHADPAWDGVSVPVGQQCQSQGGVNPSTPSILVSKIPGGSDAIILEFSDRDFPPMDDGGHGKVGFRISEGTEAAVIPSIPGHTFILPEGFFLIQAHQAPDFDTAGAYMPPCSGGIGNAYYVTVRAVKLLSADGKTFTPLGEGILELGSY